MVTVTKEVETTVIKEEKEELPREVITLYWNDPSIPSEINRGYIGFNTTKLDPEMLTGAGHIKEFDKVKGFLYRIIFDESYVFQRLDKVFSDLGIVTDEEFDELITTYKDGYAERTAMNEYLTFIKSNDAFKNVSYEKYLELKDIIEKYK